MTKPPTRVVFFQVNDSQTKCHKIVQTALMHFEKKEPFLIFVEDEKAALFVDDLLWKYPSTSFLPHRISNASCEDLITITLSKNNVNKALFAFNLCSSPLLLNEPLNGQLEAQSRPFRAEQAELSVPCSEELVARFRSGESPPFTEEFFKTIYDFEDISSSVKKNLSSSRFDSYKKSLFFIEAR